MHFFAQDKQGIYRMSKHCVFAISDACKINCIATDKALFSSGNADIFLISPQKHMLWVLIRSTLARCF